MIIRLYRYGTDQPSVRKTVVGRSRNENPRPALSRRYPDRHDFELKNSVFGMKNFVIPKIRCTFDTDFAFLGFDAGLELTVDLRGGLIFWCVIFVH